MMIRRRARGASGWAASQAADFQTYLRKTKPAAVIEGEWPVLPPEDASGGDF